MTTDRPPADPFDRPAGMGWDRVYVDRSPGGRPVAAGLVGPYPAPPSPGHRRQVYTGRDVAVTCDAAGLVLHTRHGAG